MSSASGMLAADGLERAVMIGDEWAKAGQELGKAGQEIGKATGKGIDAAQTAGGFFGKYLAAPLEEASGILTDRLRYTRWERRARLIQRAQIFLQAQGCEAPTRRLPLGIGVPLIEAGSLEDDDALQDVWAQLLANGADANFEQGIRRAFVTILSDLTSLDAKILSMIVNAPSSHLDKDGYVRTIAFPHGYLAYGREAMQAALDPHTDVAIWNLSRLGCIELGSAWEAASALFVRSTSLGRAFVAAVTRQGGAE